MKKITRLTIGTLLIFSIILSGFSFTAYGKENAVTSTDTSLYGKISLEVKERIVNGDDIVNVVVVLKYRLSGDNQDSQELLQKYDIPVGNFEYEFGYWGTHMSLWLTPEQIIAIAGDDEVDQIWHFDRLLQFDDNLYKAQNGRLCIKFSAQDALNILQVAVGILDLQETMNVKHNEYYQLNPDLHRFKAEHALMALQSSVGKIDVNYVWDLIVPE